MGRRTKYSAKIEDKLTMFIRDGLTISDACYGAGISVATFNRWRHDNVKFNQAINEATSRQWESSFALAKYGARKYRRRFQAPNYQLKTQKAITEPLRTSQRVFNGASNPAPSTWHGLPIANMYQPVKKTNQYYYDPEHDRVFRKVDGVLQSMSSSTWERKNFRCYDEPFLGIVI